jgi:hypothetical protein
MTVKTGACIGFMTRVLVIEYDNCSIYRNLYLSGYYNQSVENCFLIEKVIHERKKTLIIIQSIEHIIYWFSMNKVYYTLTRKTQQFHLQPLSIIK